MSMFAFQRVCEYMARTYAQRKDTVQYLNELHVCTKHAHLTFHAAKAQEQHNTSTSTISNSDMDGEPSGLLFFALPYEAYTTFTTNRKPLISPLQVNVCDEMRP